MATHLLAVVYPDVATAERALARLRELDGAHVLVLEDAVLARKQPDGELCLEHDRALAAGDGLVAGGSLGLLIGILVGVPVAGALLGIATGGGVSALDRGIPDDRMRSVGRELRVGQAAVLALATVAEWRPVREALTELGGELVVAQLDEVVLAALGAGTEAP